MGSKGSCNLSMQLLDFCVTLSDLFERHEQGLGPAYQQQATMQLANGPHQGLHRCPPAQAACQISEALQQSLRLSSYDLQSSRKAQHF